MAVNDDSVSIENLKGAISLGSQTLKSLEIINGGAVLAILTFYGNSTSDGKHVSFDKWYLSLSLVVFALGLFSAVASTCLAYLGQLTVATCEPSYTTDESERTRHLEKQAGISDGLIMWAIIVAVVSLVFFLAGTCIVAWALFHGSSTACPLK